MTTDRVLPAVADAVIARDRGCVAPGLGAPDSCRDRWGHAALATRIPLTYHRSALTLDHVKDAPRMGKRAPSDAQHLVTLCWHHHLNGWATAHRPELRQYLKEVTP